MNHSLNSYRCKSPVAFLVFNRPETTRKVFAEIANVRPKKLFVVADGPRRNCPGEKEQCEAVRTIIDSVDWDCELSIEYAEENMGCARRVSSGIDWVFGKVEEAIFLEDDCLPHPSFFRFCDEMLERYRDDERVMAVSGDNFQFGKKRWNYSYYFSRYVHVWGWASWRRAWKFYDLHMSNWPMVHDGGWLNDILEDRRATNFWTNVFEQAHRGKTGTWDYQWVFACWLNSGLSIVPNVNLISNIGFGAGATHTSSKSRVAGMPTQEMIFPLTHPPMVVRDSRADARAARLFFRTSRLSPIKRAVRHFLG